MILLRVWTAIPVVTLHVVLLIVVVMLLESLFDMYFHALWVISLTVNNLICSQPLALSS